jgi:hypothetical protein
LRVSTTTTSVEVISNSNELFNGSSIAAECTALGQGTHVCTPSITGVKCGGGRGQIIIDTTSMIPTTQITYTFILGGVITMTYSFTV